MSSLYLHIPFCQKKCNYCSFVSFENSHKQFEPYFAAIKKEINKKTQNKKLKTLYIGGGTPSIIPIKLYKDLRFNFAKNYEFTFEVNPKTVNKEYLSELKNIGVNRLSIGVQSFENDLLNTIGRTHNSNEAIKCIEMTKDVGFKNINIDLIYGLPNQTMKIWKKSLKTACNLDIQHISTYGLKIEKNTPFGKNLPKNLPDEDLCANMYLECIKTVAKANLQQYEISNFAQKGFESKHNINYWKNKHYIACGIAAHGYEGNIRYENQTNLKKYIENPLKPFAKKELSQQEILEEAIFLGLRMNKGINLNEFKAKYNIDFMTKYGFIIEKYNEFFIKTNDSIALNTEGFMLSNSILSCFIS